VLVGQVSAFAPGGFTARLRGADGRGHVVACRYEGAGAADAVPPIELPPVAGPLHDLATDVAFPERPGMRVWGTQ
jgi:hypothetical protein